MKKIFLLILILSIGIVSAQNETSPVFKGCESVSQENLETCFKEKLTSKIKEEFKIPSIVTEKDYKGILNIVFNVTKKGEFKVIYVNSIYPELEQEAKRIFNTLESVQPATYHGRAVEKQYILPLYIPDFEFPEKEKIDVSEEIKTAQENHLKTETKSKFLEHHSQLNIPFTHEKYDQLQFGLDKNENAHTSVKPYIYQEVSEDVALDAQKTALLKNKSSWFGKKLFNEHLVKIAGDNFWFTLDPAFDVQVGKDNNANDYTYNNTRAVTVQGAIGKKLSFYTSIYESQGRFANYINHYNRLNNVVTGRGSYKTFKDTGFDYPVSEAYLSYSPNKIFNFQFGNGKNFIGDGYRSLILSDVAAPYPYVKISTKFWKIRYTNLWMFMDDIRPENRIDGTNLRKFVSFHHLSINLTKKWNLGLFESIVTNNKNKDGLSINYLNPIIFYRNVEFNRGSQSGNAMLGLNTSYKIKDNVFAYGQFILDELTIKKLTNGNGNWANKFGAQLGFKYYNAFNIPNLYFQGEANIVRPFTYSHRDSTLNYGHFNEPIAHAWGSNFYELIGIARYQKDRWYANTKLVFGKKGFDFDNSTASYGGNIFIPYTERVGNLGNNITNGNTSTIFNANLDVGYLLNPSTNLKVFANFTYRTLNPTTQSTNLYSEDTTWFSFGLKTDLFNWYFDK